MTLREYYTKLKSIDLQRLKEEAVEACKKEIIEANQSQLREGKNANGQVMRPPYSEAYRKRKSRMSSYRAPYGIPDLYLTGEFQEAFDVIVDNGQYDIISWDEKTAFLQLMYDNIFGLSPENIDKIRLIVTSKLRELLNLRLN